MQPLRRLDLHSHVCGGLRGNRYSYSCRGQDPKAVDAILAALQLARIEEIALLEGETPADGILRDVLITLHPNDTDVHHRTGRNRQGHCGLVGRPIHLGLAIDLGIGVALLPQLIAHER